MENQDLSLEGNGEEPKTPPESAGEGDPKTPPEGFVPKEQFTASQTEAIRLKKELEALKTPSQDKNLPEDKKKIFEYLSEYEKQKFEDAKKEDEELKSNLDKLHSIHGDFDDKKLLSIVDDYGVYSENGDVNWEKAVDLYKKLGNQVVKRVETGTRTSDNPVEVGKVDVRGKNMHEIIGDFKRKFGIGS